jgi:cell division protease FtsH
MSSEVGPVYLGTGEEHVFLGREIVQEKAFSDNTATRLDKAVREMIEVSLQSALTIINENRVHLETLVAALLEKETLDASEVIAMLGQPVRSEAATVITEKQAEEAIEAQIGEAPNVESPVPSPVITPAE